MTQEQANQLQYIYDKTNIATSDILMYEIIENLTTYTTPIDGYYSVTSLNTSTVHTEHIKIDNVVRTTNTVFTTHSGNCYVYCNGIFYLKKDTVIAVNKAAKFTVICYKPSIL